MGFNSGFKGLKWEKDEDTYANRESASHRNSIRGVACEQRKSKANLNNKFEHEMCAKRITKNTYVGEMLSVERQIPTLKHAPYSSRRMRLLSLSKIRHFTQPITFSFGADIQMKMSVTYSTHSKLLPKGS